MLQAYLNPQNLSHWGQLACAAPGAVSRTFFFSNFWFLPALFLVVVVVNRFTMRLRMIGAEKWLLLTTLALFAVHQPRPADAGLAVARQRDGAHLPAGVRGDDSVHRALDRRRRGTARSRGAAVDRPARSPLVTLANAAVIFGPALHITLADRVYLSFYRHADAARAVEEPRHLRPPAAGVLRHEHHDREPADEAGAEGPEGTQQAAETESAEEEKEEAARRLCTAPAPATTDTTRVIVIASTAAAPSAPASAAGAFPRWLIACFCVRLQLRRSSCPAAG